MPCRTVDTWGQKFIFPFAFFKVLAFPLSGEQDAKMDRKRDSLDILFLPCEHSRIARELAVVVLICLGLDLQLKDPLPEVTLAA